jgi:hypothetical protein
MNQGWPADIRYLSEVSLKTLGVNYRKKFYNFTPKQQRGKWQSKTCWQKNKLGITVGSYTHKYDI